MPVKILTCSDGDHLEKKCCCVVRARVPNVRLGHTYELDPVENPVILARLNAGPQKAHKNVRQQVWIKQNGQWRKHSTVRVPAFPERTRDLAIAVEGTVTGVQFGSSKNPINNSQIAICDPFNPETIQPGDPVDLQTEELSWREAAESTCQRLARPLVKVEGIGVPEDPNPGEVLEAQVTLVNLSPVKGTADVAVTLDDTNLATLSDEVLGEGSLTRSVRFTVPDRESFQICAGQECVEIDVVRVGVENLEHPRTATTGREVEVRVTLKNVGETGGTSNVPVVLDGERVSTITEQVAPGEEKAVRVKLTMQTAGVHRVQVGRKTGTIRSGHPDVQPISIDAPPVATGGQEFQVAVRLINTGNISGSANVAVTLNGETVETITDRVGVGQSITREIEMMAPPMEQATICADDLCTTVRLIQKEQVTQ